MPRTTKSRFGGKAGDEVAGALKTTLATLNAKNP
jgi:hypothetical protein